MRKKLRRNSLLTFENSRNNRRSDLDRQLRRKKRRLRSRLHSIILDDDGNKRQLMRRTSSFGGAPLIVSSQAVKVKEPGSIRWFILFLVCMLLFGNYYAYDNPAALNVTLQKHLGVDYDTWQYELNLLYSVYSFPNMFLPMISGHLIDKFDAKIVLIVLGTLVCVGQTIFALGVNMKIFPLMVAGRILFGIGGESMSVVQSSVTTMFFRDKELSFALGMNICIGRLGSVVNSVLSPRLALAFSTPFAVWFGCFTCYMSFLAGIILINIIAKYPPTLSPPNSPPILQDSGLYEEPLETSPLLGDVDITDVSFSTRPEDRKSTNWLNLGPISYLPTSFWILCLICICLYGTIVPFNAIASDFLVTKWYHGDIVKAGFVMSIPDFLSAFLVPIFGTIIDNYGHRISWLFVCCTVIGCSHMALGLTAWNPIPCFVFLGLSYAIYGVVIWPSVATVAQYQEDKLREQGKNVKIIGTAFGFSTAALNTALTILPLIAALIRVQTSSFVYLEIFFSSLALLAFIGCIMLYFEDLKNSFILQNKDQGDSLSDSTSPAASVESISSFQANITTPDELPEHQGPSLTIDAEAKRPISTLELSFNVENALKKQRVENGCEESTLKIPEYSKLSFMSLKSSASSFATFTEKRSMLHSVGISPIRIIASTTITSKEQFPESSSIE